MTHTNRITAAASEAIEIASNIEDWMIEAFNAEDAALTAHAIRGAAIEVIEDLKVSLSAYADGYNVPGPELYSMLSAMRSVLQWADATAA